MQFRSLIPEYVTVAAKFFATSQEDKGRLGTLTRALSVSQIASLPKISRIKYNISRPDPAWRSSRMRGLTMRRAAWITTYGLQLQVPTTIYTLASGSSDLKEIIDDCVRLQQLPVSQTTLIKHILIPLWRLKIYRLSQIVTNDITDMQSVITWNAFHQRWPDAPHAAHRALHLLTLVLCCTRTHHRAGYLTAFQNNAVINERGTDERIIPALHRVQQQTLYMEARRIHRHGPTSRTQQDDALPLAQQRTHQNGCALSHTHANTCRLKDSPTLFK